VEPGLSSYNSAVDAADSLLPLLDCAKAFIPEKYQRETPLLLKATAGLRQIGEEEAQKILDEVRNLFRKQPFSFSDENNQVSILDGGDEGLFAWVTVNYLEGFLGQSSEPTCGILDLGGGSTQIAFAVEPTISKGLGGRVKQHRFGNQTYAVYTHSIPGYGLYSARKAVLLNANSSGVCVLPYYKGVWENVTVMGGKDVLGNNEKCEQFIVSSFFQTKEECVNQDPLYRCLVDGALQPVLTNRRFHAFSFYYDRAADLRLLKDHRTMLAPRAYKDAAEKVCGLKEDAVKSTYTVLKEGDVRFLCLDNLYIYALLSHLGFSDDQQLHITRKLNGFETGAFLLDKFFLTLKRGIFKQVGA
jgi:hypothetical protein